MLNLQTARRAGAILLMAALIFTTAAAAENPQSSTEKDQKELAVTVYNSNIALVRDVRQVTLPAGTVDLRFMDIAAAVNPAIPTPYGMMAWQAAHLLPEGLLLPLP